MSPANRAALKMTHRAAIAAAERRVYTTTRAELTVFYAEVLDAVLYDRAPIAASSGPSDPPILINPSRVELTRSSWAKRAEAILAVLADVYTSRFVSAGLTAAESVSFRDSYLAAVGKRIVDLPPHAYDRVSQTVRASAGKSVPEIAADLRSVLSPAAAAIRAQLISRTETISAYNAGAVAGYRLVSQQTGEALFKEWLDTADERTRETHQHEPTGAGGQVVPLAAKFTVGGYPGDFPGDPDLPVREVANCRCAVVFGTAEELGIVPGVTNPEPPIVSDASTGMPMPMPEDGPALPSGWRGCMAPLGVATGDGRMLAIPEGGVRTRDLPMTFDWAPSREGGHDGAVMAGRIDRAWVEPATADSPAGLYGEGPLDLGGVNGAEFARQLGSGFAYTVSVDPDQVTFEQRFYGPDGNEVQFEDAIDVPDGDSLGGASLKDGYSMLDVMTDWRLAAVTAVSVPAFDQARIEPVYDYTPTPDHSGHSMVALRPANPEQYAVDGGSAANDLHVTLAYLGLAADLHPDAAEAANGAAAAAAQCVDPADTMRVAGYGVLGSEEPPATVLFLNGPAIDAAHRACAASLNEFGLEAFPDQHSPFIAHMTLGYGVPFDTAARFVGQDIPLAGATFDHGHQQFAYPSGKPQQPTQPQKPVPPLLAEDAVVATISGATDLPVLNDRKAKWDGSAAGVALQAHYTKNGKTDWAAISRAYLYKSPDGVSSIDDLKLPYARIENGTLTIVANGVIGLAGGHGITAISGVSESERSAMKSKLCVLYDKVRATFPDFPDCPFDTTQAASDDTDAEPLVAAAGQVFNRSLFEDPKLDGPTPLTVTPDGHVYGHVRTFGSCYLGFGGMSGCLEPPRSAAEYARFHVHGARMDDGSVLPVGALTFGEGHRAHGGLRASAAAYANIATVAAKVRAGEDEYGVWVSGEVVDEYRDRADDLLLAPLSGHWEPDPDNGGHLEMIAAHLVVTPGYAVRRIVASFGEDGEPISLIVAAPRAVRPEAAPSRILMLEKRLGIDPASRVSRVAARLGL